jgi:HAD superfamily hydrolase (TIGR01549 family)
MIKTIFFDFDGVLTTDSCGSHTICASIKKHIPDVPIEHIIKCYRVHQPKLLVGVTTHVDMWKDFCTCVGQNLDIEVLDEAFGSIPVNVKMVELCKKLKKDYKIGIITDNSKERFAMLKKEMKLTDIFDVIVVSGEVGARKNNAAIFVRAFDLAQCRAEECVFIDNNESNLTIPKKLGLKTIFFDDKKNDVESLIKELSAILTKEQP